MSTQKGVAILVHDGYQDLEFWYPLLRLREEGIPVTVVAVEPNRTYFSQLEYPVIPDAGIAEVQAKDFAAVVVPGGASAAAIAGEPRMAGFLKAAAAAGALLAGTAEGAATVAGAAAKDARLVTAPSTNALPEFSRALIQALTR